MGGVVSLADTTCAYLVLEGRVSLAHLIEFSHFVDLYVLEDKIYFDNAVLKNDLEPYLYSGTPLTDLESEYWDLGDAIFNVSFWTTQLYHAAPTNHTFSMGSYEYWTNLPFKEKQIIAADYESRDRISPEGSWIPMFSSGGTWSREDLLLSSHGLHYAVELVLEKLAKTPLTIMPSARNLLPFLQVFHQMDTPALQIYNQLVTVHRETVERILALTRPRSVYLPPLLSLLLSRCGNRSEIPRVLNELRDEFADFRQSVREWFAELDTTESLKEKIEIRDEMDDAISGLLKYYEYKREGFYKQVAGAFVSALEEGDVKKMLIKPTFAVIKEGMTNVLPEMMSVRRFTGLINLMDEALNVEGYSRLLQNVFGDSLDLSQKEITDAKLYRQHIQSRYGLGLSLTT